MKQLKGNITISRPHNSEGSYISIEIQDETSRCRIVKVNVPLEAFAEALTGLAYQECDLEYYNQENIGKTYESKTEVVPYEYDFSNKSKEDKELDKLNALKPFEVDGWKGDVEDLSNHHRRVKGGYSVVFRRYV